MQPATRPRCPKADRTTPEPTPRPRRSRHALHSPYRNRRARDARRDRRAGHRGAVRRDPAGAARAVAGRHPGRHERAAGDAPHARARAARRPAAQLHRRGRLRAPHPRGGLGDRHARRVLQRLHALPGRGQPGHGADHLRVPVDDHGADRHAGGQRLAVRRRHRGGRGLPDGSARAPPLEVGAHPRAHHGQPAVPLRRARLDARPGPALRDAAVRH